MGRALHRARICWRRCRVAVATTGASLVFALDQPGRQSVRIDRCVNPAASGFALGPVHARSTGRLFGNARYEHVVEERAEVREPEAATEPTRRRIEFAMRMEFRQRGAALDVYPAASRGRARFQRTPVLRRSGRRLRNRRMAGWAAAMPANAASSDGDATNRIGSTGYGGDYRA